MIEATLKDISCGHCASVVTRTVKEIDSAAKVDINIETKLVRIETSADTETVMRALATSGYPA